MAEQQGLARVPIPERGDLEAEALAFFDELARRGQPVPNVYRLLCNAPHLGAAMLQLSDALRRSVHLPPKLRELVILYTCEVNEAAYELAHHRKGALLAGVEANQVECVRDFERADCFSAAERAVLTLARELSTAPLAVRNETFRELQAYLSVPAILELAVTIGWYHLAGRLTATVDLKLEDAMRAGAHSKP